MMMYRNLVFVVLCLFSFTANGQGFLKASGKQIVDENGENFILRGMGLGGWMLQEGYMLQTASFASAQYQIKGKIQDLIGEPSTEEFYDAWLNNHVRKIDIDSLAAWGFNSVRLPMHYNLYTLPIEDEPVSGEQTWLEKGFTMTDSLISWCKQNNMYVILDLHAAPGGQGMDQAISDYDPSKPSLWESVINQDKTVALWRRLAERYKDEPNVAGYDLLNEVNWAMNDNQPLRAIYNRIVSSIREVDTKHIIFIEGNWFANDFTGLTPPWDDNLVYSPHKYWSFNDKNSIQWVLSLRDAHNVPLYFGETGENSNTWFTDAVKLFEDENIGWAWWPMKKIESTSCPLSVTKTAGYQSLLDYWENGGTAPDANSAKAILMEMTEKLKLENCAVQLDVPDALIRQPHTNDTRPYRHHAIPGVVHSTNFDLGKVGYAYYDNVIADYHLSTNNYTAWNNGWQYRNDGVDIERSFDNTNSNGFNVGWLEEGEWMQYELDIQSSEMYEVKIRTASNSFNASFHFSMDDADITNTVYIPNSGGFQNWQTVTVPYLIHLTPEDKKLRFHSEGDGFNLGSFEFISKGPSSLITTEFLKATTRDPYTVDVYLNKRMAADSDPILSDFSLLVNGSDFPISAIALDDNPRTIQVTTENKLKYGDVIKVSYTGNNLMAEDATDLVPFNLKVVQNTLAKVHLIPGLIEAEEYFFQVGTTQENCFDDGGGKNLSQLHVGDYMDYYIEVPIGGNFNLEYRTAATSETGQLRLLLVKEDGNTDLIQTKTFSPTGDWQEWTTSEQNVKLPWGEHHIRLEVVKGDFNFNWFSFQQLTDVEDLNPLNMVQVYPNPSTKDVHVQLDLEVPANISLELLNVLGQQVFKKEIKQQPSIFEIIDLSQFQNGQYILKMKMNEETSIIKRIIKL